MTHKYITIPCAFLETLRPVYLALTGEAIQPAPAINEQGTHYLFGTARLGPEAQVALLAAPGLGAQIGIYDAPPAAWGTE